MCFACDFVHAGFSFYKCYPLMCQVGENLSKCSLNAVYMIIHVIDKEIHIHIHT